MRISHLGRCAVGVCAAAIFAGCGGGGTAPCSDCAQHDITTLRITTAERTRAKATFEVLHYFNGGSGDGANPDAGLVSVEGTLYSTTYKGGANDKGTVFSITPSGTVAVLYSFKGGKADGYHPEAGLINVKGTLYGTTQLGGAVDNGTVFSVSSTGSETVLHSFRAEKGDGRGPVAGLLNVDGTLYGSTENGGAYKFGTVFAITLSGKETVLHSFGSGTGDGSHPEAGLIDVNGTLYGTTPEGGANGDGTVFSITPSGTETVLHSFGASGDGEEPSAGLVDVQGALYGTTYAGGANGGGTVFSLTPGGKETVLHSFPDGSRDGYDPYAGLLNYNGMLYGTTLYGGKTLYGVIFAITPSGKETVPYTFSASDGCFYPLGSLVNLKSTLYGTASGGGAADGTVFSLTL